MEYADFFLEALLVMWVIALTVKLWIVESKVHTLKEEMQAQQRWITPQVQEFSRRADGWDNVAAKVKILQLGS